MVNKCRGGFLRLAAKWGISSPHVISLSPCRYTLSVKQWENSSCNHNVQENVIGKEIGGQAFWANKRVFTKPMMRRILACLIKRSGSAGFVHLWSLRVQSFKFKSRLPGHLKLYLLPQEDKTSFNDLFPWSVLSKYSEVYQVGLTYAFAQHPKIVGSWLQSVVLKVMISSTCIRHGCTHDACWCTAKSIQYCKVKTIIIKKLKKIKVMIY